MKYYVLEDSKNHIYKHIFFNFNRPFLLFQTRLNSIKPRITLPPLNNINPGNKIVIFGSRYNSWCYLNSISKEKIFSFYRKINNIFSNYLFFYIPHPFEKGIEFNEIQSIFEGKLKLENSKVSSETFLYFNRDIFLCLSIGSTSSHSAYEMGFNSKVFYKLLNFNDNITKTYDQIFYDMPENFHINNFEEINQVSFNSSKEYLYDLEFFLNK